jgi:ribosomal protein L37AE/L43A
MKYKCPSCASAEEPHIISHFAPRIYQCLDCGFKGAEKDFIQKEGGGSSRFSSLPPPPPR